MNNEIEVKLRGLTPVELQSINDYFARTFKPTSLTVDDIIENSLTDKVVSLAKEIFNIGYEAGVKATNVDCGVVWEERIDAIKAEIMALEPQYPIDDNTPYISSQSVWKIINKHCGGSENE